MKAFERLGFALVIVILVAALLWVQISMQLPIIRKCRDAGYTRAECADPTIRALVVTKGE